MNKFTRWCALGMLALAYTACTDDEQQRAVPVVGPSMQVVSAGGNLAWTCDLTEYGKFDPDHGGVGEPCYLPGNGAQDEFDAVLYQGAGPTSAGTGVFGPIVRIATNNPVERGYNTSARPVQFDENTDPNHTVSLPLNALPIIYLDVPGVGDVAYREFNLDINQSASVPGLSLDEIYLFLSPDSAINSANPYDCYFGQGITSGTGLVWALDGDLDDGSEGDLGCVDAAFEDQWVLLNYKLESGSGAQDMKLLVPDSYFELSEVGGVDQCPYDGGTGRCGLWLYFYSHFGGAVEPIGTFIDWPPPGGKSDKYNSAVGESSVINNANFEEWNYIRRPYVVVEKTAVPTFDRKHLWDLDKWVREGDGERAKAAFCTVFPGEDCPAPFNYEVEALYEGYEDYNANVTGVITITNPPLVKEKGVVVSGSTGPVVVTDVLDYFLEAPSLIPTVGCTPDIGSVLEPGDVMTCSYSAVMDGYLPDEGDFITNVVEVQIKEADPEPGYPALRLGDGMAKAKFAFSETGDPDVAEAIEPGDEISCLLNPGTGEEPFCVSGKEITLIDDYATTDPVDPDYLPQMCGSGVSCNFDDWTVVAPNSVTFEYSREFSCGAEDINAEFKYLNTAKINEFGRTASAEVTVNCLKFGSKAGTKFHDLNANGQQDAGELGLPGWEITLTGTDDLDQAVNRTTSTDENGDYLFDMLRPSKTGTKYTVTETLQSGWTCSYPNPAGTPAVSTDCSHEFEVTTAGEDHVDNDFGNWTTATKEGVKFEDLDKDGEPREAGEPGLANWKIYVDYNGNDAWDEGEPFDMTGSDGSYKIEGIIPGTYGVREVPQPDWTCSYPAGCEYNETFKSRDALTGNDFGNWTYATKSGTKYLDNDGDGGFDSPLGGYTIYVDYDNDGALDAGEPSDVTDTNGTYEITGILPGTWRVREIQLNSMWICTFPATSDAFGCYHEETFESSGNYPDNNFANHPPQPETAWAANGDVPLQLPFNLDGGNWATYVDTEGQTRFYFCTTLFMSQTYDAGQVCFTDVGGGYVQIDITLNSNYMFMPGGVIRIQDYEVAPIGESSAPGQFDHSGTVTGTLTGTATVPMANYYAVHALVINMGG